MKKRIPLLLALLILGAAALMPMASAQDYRQITMDEAVAMMESETGYIILDVRTVSE